MPRYCHQNQEARKCKSCGGMKAYIYYEINLQRDFYLHCEWCGYDSMKTPRLLSLVSLKASPPEKRGPKKGKTF